MLKSTQLTPTEMSFELLTEIGNPSYEITIDDIQENPLEHKLAHVPLHDLRELHHTGTLPPKFQKCVAIVGIRSGPNGTELAVARSLAYHLVLRRCATIVSGGAFGIDTAAHQGAMWASAKNPHIQNARFSTILVNAASVNSPYKADPQTNPERFYMYSMIARKYGAVVSEHSPGSVFSEAPGISRYLINRNKITAGLPSCVIAFTGSQDSGGTIRTINLALEMKTPVIFVSYEGVRIDAIRNYQNQPNVHLLSPEEILDDMKFILDPEA